MKIRRIFNNNSMLAVEDSGIEKVLFGNGIGFKANVGEVVNMDKVEKIFVYENDEANSRLKNLLSNVSMDIVTLTFDVIEYCKSNLNSPVSDYLYVTLTDHLNFAIKMYDNGQVNPNMIMWEIKRFYPKEFKLGLKALEFIYEETGKKLDEFEAGHIALHLINAQLNIGNSNINRNVIEITKKINDILNIIKYRFKVDLDSKSFEYERFVFHLRHFFTRLSSENKKNHLANEFLFKEVLKQYPQEYKCVGKIEEYLGQKLDVDEKLYLTMHIARIVN
jgi:beta-glucoside operon transcriptional antiterminator